MRYGRAIKASIRDSPDRSRSDISIRAFLAFLQDRGELWPATITLGSTNDRRGDDLFSRSPARRWQIQLAI